MIAVRWHHPSRPQKRWVVSIRLFSFTMRWDFLWFTGSTLTRRTRAVIIRSPAAGSASMIVRICASTVVSTTGRRGAGRPGGRS